MARVAIAVQFDEHGAVTRPSDDASWRGIAGSPDDARGTIPGTRDLL